MAYKGHYALFHNFFRIIKCAFQIMHNIFQLPRNTFWIHYKFWNLHNTFQNLRNRFRNSATLSPQDPKYWPRKGYGYAASPPSFDAIFCSTCRQQLQEIFFCPQMSPMEAATLTARKMIFSKHSFWLVLSTTPFWASSKSSTAFTFQVKMMTFQ